jgi:hypothetical protein
MGTLCLAMQLAAADGAKRRTAEIAASTNNDRPCIGEILLSARLTETELFFYKLGSMSLSRQP